MRGATLQGNNTMNIGGAIPANSAVPISRAQEVPSHTHNPPGGPVSPANLGQQPIDGFSNSVPGQTTGINSTAALPNTINVTLDPATIVLKMLAAGSENSIQDYINSLENDAGGLRNSRIINNGQDTGVVQPGVNLSRLGPSTPKDLNPKLTEAQGVAEILARLNTPQGANVLIDALIQKGTQLGITQAPLDRASARAYVQEKLRNAQFAPEQLEASITNLKRITELNNNNNARVEEGQKKLNDIAKVEGGGGGGRG
jgi:hypothetical protein